MNPDPIPFITSLKRQADRFADTLVIVTLATIALFLGAMWTHTGLGWFSQMTVENLRRYAINTAVFTVTFYALAYLIDYAIYATLRALAEVLAHAVSKDEGTPTGVTVDTSVTFGSTVDASSIAYLRDRMHRTDPPKGH